MKPININATTPQITSKEKREFIIKTIKPHLGPNPDMDLIRAVVAVRTEEEIDGAWNQCLAGELQFV